MKKSIFTLNLLDSKLRKYFKRNADKWDPNKNWRWPSICYTLEHKLAYLEREHYLLGRYTMRGILHDWEKPFLYKWSKMSESEIQQYHRINNPHHIESKKYHKIEHLIEMYIDWECASLTKPDKPLNAFETLIHFYTEYINLMLPVCMAFDLNNISSNVYLHSWHKLQTEESYNKQVYEKVIKGLDQMQGIQHWSLLLKDAKKIYKEGCGIENMSLPMVFILMVDFINKGKINYECINNHIKDTYLNMKQSDKFLHSPLNSVEHSYNKIKVNLFYKNS